MKRVRRRISLLAAIRIAVGMVLFAVIWELISGKNDATGGVAFLGLLLYLVAEAWFSGESNVAIEAVNVRIDGELIRNDGQDDLIARQAELIGDLRRRVAALEGGPSS